MHKSNLLDVLRSMDKAEIEQFTRFVNSPYFNTSSAATQLYITLKEFYPEFKEKDVRKEELFKKVYRNRTYNDVLMRKIISTILKLTGEYFSIKRYRADKLQTDINLMKELNERNLDLQFNENLRKAEKDWNNSKKYKNEDYYFHQYHLNSIVSEFKLLRGNVLTVDEHQIQIDSINRYYLLNTLKLYALLFMHSRAYGVEYNLIMLDEIKGLFKGNAYESEPELLVFYYTMMLFAEGPVESENYFLSLKKLLNAARTLLNKEDIDFMYGMMIQYCVQMTAVYGQAEYSKEKWDLAKARIEVKLERTDLIHPTDFVNAVSMSISERQYEWTKKFINDFKQKLAPTFRKDTINFSYAWLLFAKENYEEALKYLSKLSPVFFQSKSYIKELSIKIYYELRMIEQVYYGVDSYLHYLKNDRTIPEYIRKRDLMFIKNIKKLLKLSEDGNKEDLNLLFKSIENFNVSSKDWFLRKLKELTRL
jgi:hypothetical protein